MLLNVIMTILFIMPLMLNRLQHQFCARRSYMDFLKKMGVEAQHQEAILKHGYGYKRELSNFHLILEKYKISEESVFNHFERRILVNEYDMIFENLVKFLREKKVKNAEVIIKKLRWKEKKFKKFMDGK